MMITSVNPKMNSPFLAIIVLLCTHLWLWRPMVVQSFSVGGNVRRTTSSTSKTALHASSSLREDGGGGKLLHVSLNDPGKVKAFEQQPPHAGCHFRPTHPAYASTKGGGERKDTRFFEGWYYRVTLPEANASFAFIFSIEDPFAKKDSPLSLSCHQIMGPNDEYLVQADKDDTKFWAWEGQQGVGCVFENNFDDEQLLLDAVDPNNYDVLVKSGFQMLPTRLQGKLIGHDGSLGGVMEGQGVPGECEYDLSIEPIAGWGDAIQGQKSTAGWLASYKVFEPHWQVTMADARATGHVTWKGKRYEVKDMPFYGEKNWGGAFPIKWYWCQCNSFKGFISEGTTLSVTAGGGTRKIPLGQTESLGMVSVHYNGTFYEATPWLGDMEWHVAPWGYWNLTGRCTGGVRPFEVELTALCHAPGVKLRAPTEKDGMKYFCRDSFMADATLSLWELEWNGEAWVRSKCVIDAATSSDAAVELGGGPWWDDWKDTSIMKQPMKGMVRLPYRLSNLQKRLFSRTRKSKEV